MEATAVAASFGSLNIPRSTKRTEPAKAASRLCATATATAVLPTPPVPTMVTKREAVSSADNLRTSSSRPTILVRRLGRLACGKLVSAAGTLLFGALACETGDTKQYPRPEIGRASCRERV